MLSHCFRPCLFLLRPALLLPLLLLNPAATFAQVK